MGTNETSSHSIYLNKNHPRTLDIAVLAPGSDVARRPPVGGREGCDGEHVQGKQISRTGVDQLGCCSCECGQPQPVYLHQRHMEYDRESYARDRCASTRDCRSGSYTRAYRHRRQHRVCTAAAHAAPPEVPWYLHATECDGAGNHTPPPADASALPGIYDSEDGPSSAPFRHELARHRAHLCGTADG